MDLQAAEKLNARSWNLPKIAALVCFALASAVLVSSLLRAKTHVRLGAPITVHVAIHAG